ncbi:CGNR zinc finger domain-containing protein [Streptomyces sp. NPDC012888]
MSLRPDAGRLRRRWCSMDRCGNLAEIAAYRSRRSGGRLEGQGA